MPFDLASTDLCGTPKVLQHSHTRETNQIDFFSQTVDFMAMSIKLRKSWELSREEQASFDGFEYVSSSMLEAELDGNWVCHGGNSQSSSSSSS